MRITVNTQESYDSTEDTKKHIAEVVSQGKRLTDAITTRLENHDASKLVAPEKDYFDKYTPMLAKMQYGSPEYKECLEGLKPALDHHYAENTHHPEHFKGGIDEMDLVDLFEMFCDWCAAVKLNKNGDIYKSLEINKDRFKMSEQLVSILKNTADHFKD